MKKRMNYKHFRFQRNGTFYKVLLKKDNREVDFGEVRYDKKYKEYILDIMNYTEYITSSMARELSYFLKHTKPQEISKSKEKEDEKD